MGGKEESKEIRRRKREERQSVTQKQRQKDGMDLQAECLPCGPRWPKVNQETAHCVTLHFVSCMASYFWKMGASTLVAWAYFFLCVFVKRASQHSATHNALLKYITISQKALLTFLYVFQSSLLDLLGKNVACIHLCPAGMRLVSVCGRKRICCMSSSSLLLSVTL